MISVTLRMPHIFGKFQTNIYLCRCMVCIIRCWVARNFGVWRTHTRTSIIDPHALPHRTMIFDDRTRTRTRTCKRVQSFISLSKKDCTFTALPNNFFYLTENVLTTYYYTYTNPFIFHYLSSPDTFTRTCNFRKSIFFNIF